MWLALGSLLVVGTLILRKPNAQQRRVGSGGMVDDRWAWIWMELPAVLVFLCFFLFRDGRQPLDWVWLLLWEGHYVYRDLLYPQRRRSLGKTTPRSIVIMGAVFNIANGVFNGYYIYRFRPAHHTAAWLVSAPFMIGVVMMAVGFSIMPGPTITFEACARSAQVTISCPTRGCFAGSVAPTILGR